MLQYDKISLSFGTVPSVQLLQNIVPGNVSKICHQTEQFHLLRLQSRQNRISCISIYCLLFHRVKYSSTECHNPAPCFLLPNRVFNLSTIVIVSVILYNSNPKFLHLFLKRSFGNAILIFLEKFYFLAANGYICIVCQYWFDL